MENWHNNIDSAWRYPIQWAACVVVDDAKGLFYLTQEKESAWRKESWHLWLAWWRQEPNENIIDLIKRELQEEAGIFAIDEESLINIWNVTLNDVWNQYPQIDVALFSLFSKDLSPVSNNEVNWLLLKKGEIGELIKENPRQFRPLMLEALYFHILKQTLSVNTIMVENCNYQNISPKIIKELIDYYQ